jgi:hypothetical protein
MADTAKERFINKNFRVSVPALPEPPKIPEEIKNRWPDMRQHWEKFDQELADYFKKQATRNR